MSDQPQIIDTPTTNIAQAPSPETLKAWKERKEREHRKWVDSFAKPNRHNPYPVIPGTAEIIIRERWKGIGFGLLLIVLGTINVNYGLATAPNAITTLGVLIVYVGFWVFAFIQIFHRGHAQCTNPECKDPEGIKTTFVWSNGRFTKGLKKCQKCKLHSVRDGAWIWRPDYAKARAEGRHIP